jgi:hypothetical protein
VAGLTGPFRFVTSVTILQQSICQIICRILPVADPDRSEGQRVLKAQADPEENHRFAAPAEELGKGWRFFPTYAGV